jgi:hypothetical protein
VVDKEGNPKWLTRRDGSSPAGQKEEKYAEANRRENEPHDPTRDRRIDFLGRPIAELSRWRDWNTHRRILRV